MDTELRMTLCVVGKMLTKACSVFFQTHLEAQRWELVGSSVLECKRRREDLHLKTREARTGWGTVSHGREE